MSSAYRYVQDLLATGFLDEVQGGYMLEPALIELAYLIQQHDPLIRAAAPFMRVLLERTVQQGAVILYRRFRDRVRCIHQEHGPNRTQWSAMNGVWECRSSSEQRPA